MSNISYENVKLWFAKDGNGDIVTINEVNESNKKNTYNCPMCGSKLIPKAVKSKQVSSHFAHVDVSQCGESMYHYWFKHKFLEKGDTFTVVSNKEKEYVVRDVEVEQEYQVEECIYRPDITILTECDNVIYFEMAFSNKKKIKDYLDIWLELKNIVVEVNIKTLMNQDKAPKFKALFYNGKCFNTKRNDTYYNTIGKYKEEKLSGKVDEKLKERIKKLDWFWDDVFRYKKGEVDIEHIVTLIDNIDTKDKGIIDTVLKKPKCSGIYEDCLNFKLDKTLTEILDYTKDKYGDNTVDYFDKEVERVSEPFYGTFYDKRIRIFDSHKKKYINFDTEYNDLSKFIEYVDEIIPRNIEYKKTQRIKQEYNDNVNIIWNKIEQLSDFDNFRKYLMNETGYALNLKLNYFNARRKNLNKFKIIVYLYFGNNEVESFSVDKEFTFCSQANDICHWIISNANNYIDNVEPIDNLKELLNFTTYLREKFDESNIDIEHSLAFEDVYQLQLHTKDRKLSNGYEISGHHIKDYYIYKNKLEISDNIKEESFQIKSFNELKKLIEKEIEESIIEHTRKQCFECRSEFHLELGEIKFFTKKGFIFPKRCKSCRNKRKQNKQ